MDFGVFVCSIGFVNVKWQYPYCNTDRQKSERLALDAKKREQFQKLKEQFAKDQEVFLCLFLKAKCVSYTNDWKVILIYCTEFEWINI